MSIELKLPLGTQTVDTRIGKLDFELGVPTKATVEKLYDEMDFERAVQCYLWGDSYRRHGAV
jgi:hypothetical protein